LRRRRYIQRVLKCATIWIAVPLAENAKRKFALRVVRSAYARAAFSGGFGGWTLCQPLSCGCAQAAARAEPQAALTMVEEIPGQQGITLGADKGYYSKEFVQELRDHQITPHIALSTSVTTRHPGDVLSQQKRKRIEEMFAWLKTVAGLRKTRHRGVARVGWMFTFTLAAYNLVRMRNLAAVA
jgi:hypothetical protein